MCIRDREKHLQRDRYNTEIYLLCMCDHITVDHHISGYSPVHIKNAVDGNRGADDILYHLAVYDGWICCIRTEKDVYKRQPQGPSEVPELRLLLQQDEPLDGRSC